MDAGEALRDHRADAELGRSERGMLAARALSVVVAGDDEAPPTPSRASGSGPVLESELGDRGDV